MQWGPYDALHGSPTQEKLNNADEDREKKTNKTDLPVRVGTVRRKEETKREREKRGGGRKPKKM